MSSQIINSLLFMLHNSITHLLLCFNIACFGFGLALYVHTCMCVPVSVCLCLHTHTHHTHVCLFVCEHMHFLVYGNVHMCVCGDCLSQFSVAVKRHGDQGSS